MTLSNQSVEDALNLADENIKKAIAMSLQEIKNNSEQEEEYFDLYTQYITGIGQYFKLEVEKTDNQHLIKNIKKRITKQLIFKI